MIHFILIRHGETLWTKERRYQGSSNTKLTAKGRKQIQPFVREITKYHPDIIFSSGLDRVKESAQILCEPLNKRPKIDRRLDEIGFGIWEGKTANELVEENDPVYMKWLRGKVVTPKGGEAFNVFEKRVIEFIEDCRKKHDNKKIVIVTHGGVIRLFLIYILMLSREYMFRFRVDPGTMTILGDYQYTKQLTMINSPRPIKGLVPTVCV